MTFHIHNARRRQAAMTLLEIMVASTLLLVIVLGLTAMFHQTQRAFQTGMRQSDVLEGGRAIVDLIMRDLEQLKAPQARNGTNVVLHPTTKAEVVFPDITHLYAAPLGGPGNPVAASINNILGGDRGTELHECWFLTEENNRWSSLGYIVRASDATDTQENSLRSGYGTLYRYARELPVTGLIDAGDEFFRMPMDRDRFRRVADGLVHFRLWSYDAGGMLITNQPSLDVLEFAHTNMPSYLELEIGILEPQALDQLKAIPNTQAAREFIARNRHRIHIFRQQVAVRTASRIQ